MVVTEEGTEIEEDMAGEEEEEGPLGTGGRGRMESDLVCSV